MWKVKKEAPLPEIKPVETEIESEEESLEDLENQQRVLQERLKRIESKKTEEKSLQPTKQELIDAIQGNNTRNYQLIEMLRRY